MDRLKHGIGPAARVVGIPGIHRQNLVPSYGQAARNKRGHAGAIQLSGAQDRAAVFEGNSSRRRSRARSNGGRKRDGLTERRRIWRRGERRSCRDTHSLREGRRAAAQRFVALMNHIDCVAAGRKR